MIVLIAVGALATVVSAIGVALFRRNADRLRLLDVPNQRSLHQTPVPRGAGVLIVVITISGCALAWATQRSVPGTFEIAALAGGALVAWVSWFDDRRSQSARVRMAVHLAAAVLVLLPAAGFSATLLPGASAFSVAVAGVVAVLWLVGLTNAYNFMDGIDGLAGGQAVIAGLAWAALGVTVNDWNLALPGVLIAGSSLGFLLHNWSPARVFMGDVGSTFLGYAFAVLCLMGTARHPNLFLPGVLVMGLFVFDTSFTFLRRWRAGENVFGAHRSHIYQRLVIAGMSHSSVVLVYLGIATAGAIAAYGVASGSPMADRLAVAGVPLVAASLVWGVGARERLSVAQKKRAETRAGTLG